MTNTIENYGYLVLNGVEANKAWRTRKPTDEFWGANQQWIASGIIQGAFCDCDIYRRKIQPGEGFEIVPLDGVIQEGDTFTPDGIEWRIFWHKEAGREIKELVESHANILAIRRPISRSLTEGKPAGPDSRIINKGAGEQAAGSQSNGAWVDVATRLPVDPRPYLVWRNGCKINRGILENGIWKEAAHKSTFNPQPLKWFDGPCVPSWMPEKSDCEKAFESLWNKHCEESPVYGDGSLEHQTALKWWNAALAWKENAK